MLNLREILDNKPEQPFIVLPAKLLRACTSVPARAKPTTIKNSVAHLQTGFLAGHCGGIKAPEQDTAEGTPERSETAALTWFLAQGAIHPIAHNATSPSVILFESVAWGDDFRGSDTTNCGVD